MLNFTFTKYTGNPNFRTSNENENWSVLKFQKSRAKLQFDGGPGKGTTFGSSYWEVPKTQGRRNRNSTVG